MTTPTPPDIAALIERLNPVAQDMSLGPTDALRHYPHAHPQHRAAEFGHDLRTALAALTRLSDDLAREREATDYYPSHEALHDLVQLFTSSAEVPASRNAGRLPFAELRRFSSHEARTQNGG